MHSKATPHLGAKPSEQPRSPSYLIVNLMVTG